jgi:hypothetical protein
MQQRTLEQQIAEAEAKLAGSAPKPRGGFLRLDPKNFSELLLQAF